MTRVRTIAGRDVIQDDEKGYREQGRRRAGSTPPLFFARRKLQLNPVAVARPKVNSPSAEEPMNGEQHNDQPTKERDDVVRRPDEADEDQLDEAIEETFPASDPISP